MIKKYLALSFHPMSKAVRYFVGIIVCELLVFNALGNHFNQTTGARSAALGNQAVALIDVFSANNNQAGIGFIEDISFGVFAKNKFILKDLNHVNAIAILPTKTGVFGFNVNYFGGQLYNEKKIGLSFGKSFGERFSFGLQFDYLNMSIREYGNRNLITFEAGLQYYLLPDLLIGAHVNNPLRLDIDEESTEKLATIMRFGLNYSPSKKVFILFEVEKDIDFKPLFKAGIEYHIVEKFVLRGGFNANPFSGSFGLGVILKTLRIDMAAVMHPVLGVSPSLSLIYAIPKKQ